MSQQDHKQDSQLANFTGIVLTLAFVSIFALVSANFGSPQIISPESDSQAAAPTQPPPPTSAPTQPPTSTPPPPDTPIPDEAEVSQPAVYDPALVERGAALFVQCAACHGADGRGIPNLGKDLVESEFMDGLTDDELLQFIVTGRPIWDPLNTTGLDMPGKGGNPALTNDDILAIIAYIRSLPAQDE